VGEVVLFGLASESLKIKYDQFQSDAAPQIVFIVLPSPPYLTTQREHLIGICRQWRFALRRRRLRMGASTLEEFHEDQGEAR
jgi:hypothetical protein